MTYLEIDKFYTLKSVVQNRSYVIYTCKTYDDEMMQLNISLNKNVLSWYIGNNNVRDENSNFPNIISYEQKGIVKNQLKITYNDGVYEITKGAELAYIIKNGAGGRPLRCRTLRADLYRQGGKSDQYHGCQQAYL